jgi:PAS domain S-box-containing protein
MDYKKHEIPEQYLKKWQQTVELLAKIFEVPAGLIMRVLPKQIEVLVSSHTECNPYDAYEKADLNTGLYCETVMKTRSQLNVVNALEEEEWKNNPDVKLDMISYLGIPLLWPGNHIFGTICVLDSKARKFSKNYQDLLWEFKRSIENDLKIIQQSKKLEKTNKELQNEIYERKLAEEALQESEKKHRDLLESIDDWVWSIDLDGVHTFSNEATESMLGYKVNEIIGTSSYPILHADDQEKIQDVVRKSIENKEGWENIEIRWIHKDGSIRYIMSSSKPIFDGENLVGFSGIDHNITERKKVEEEIREREKKYREILEGLNDVPYRMSLPDGKYEYFGQAAQSVFGYDSEKWLLNPNLIKEIIHPDFINYFKEKWTDLIKGILPKTFEYKIIDPDGYEKWIFQSNTGIYDDQNNLIAIEGLCRDITEQKQTEKTLQKAHIELETKVAERTIDYKNAKEEAERANKLKSEFLANISHEIRTPMHGILSFSKFGIDKIEEASKEKNLNYFKKIKTAGDRLMGLLDNILDLSKMEAGKEVYKMKTVDIWELINNTTSEMETIRKEKKLKITVEDPVISTKTVCDKSMIDQVIRNLLSNAMKFTPENNQIIIIFNPSELPFGQRLTDKKLISALKVSVKDEGVGIPDDELNSVFDKFIQSSKTKTGAGGTGLGLAICKEIIQGHNGKIWAVNNPEGGATFHFVLPIEQNGNLKK